jgi:Mg2+ and Co2+ transporter CorA
MITKHISDTGIIWNIAISPTQEELTTIMNEMSLPEEYLEELKTPTPQPVCTNIQGTTYAVFHVPVHSPADAEALHYTEEEVDVLIRDKTIVTIFYNTLDIFDINPEYALKHHKNNKPLELWFDILTHIYKNKHKDVDNLVVQVKELREKVFTNKEHIETISDIHRAYLAIDFPISTHGDIIESMLEEQSHAQIITATQKTVRAHITARAQGELHRLTQKLDKLGAYIHELRDTQSTLISARQNSLIQTFTILTFIFLPINFFAALFGMNVINMPIVHHPLGFWILSGSFAALSSILLIFFKIRRWL